MGLDMHELWMSGMPLKPDLWREYARNCEAHQDHGYATPRRVLRHFILPQPLQVLTFGEVKDDRSVLVCPIGVDNVLCLIREYVEADPRMEHWEPDSWRGRRPLSVHPDEVALAELGLRRFHAALAGLSQLRAKGPWAVHPNDWRCPDCGGGLTLTAAGGQHTWSHRCEGRSTSLHGIPRTAQEGT